MSWVEVNGAGWNWVKLGAWFSNTQYNELISLIGTCFNFLQLNSFHLVLSNKFFEHVSFSTLVLSLLSF